MTMRERFLTIPRVFAALVLSTALGVATSQPEPSGSFRDAVVLGALDKVTARTTEVTIKVGDIVKIGTLTVKVVKAWGTDPEERPEAKVFLEVVDHKAGKPKAIFTGWMFASNPSVSSIEHPVYDLWVIKALGESIEADKGQPQVIDEETSHRIDQLFDELMK